MAKKDTVILKVKKLHPDAVVPEKQTQGSCGLDLYVLDDTIIYPTQLQREAVILHTGLAVEIPEGYHLAVYLRSSVGKYSKLRLANGTGIIDSDYRGELVLLVENIGRDPEYIEPGIRLAQTILVKDPEFTVEVVESLSETRRGTGGFGSTGKK